MLSFSNGETSVEVEGGNVRQVIVKLETLCPGIKDALMDEDKLRPDVAVAIDGQVAQLGLLTSTPDNCEVFFIPAIGGG